jgi:cytochrome c peroxidase
MIYRITLLLFLGLTFAISCKKKENTPIEKNFGFEVPSHFPKPVYQFENDEQNYLKFAVGRDLFYDPILSIDNTISCASCHAQVHSFADHNGAFSAGVGGLLGTRNSPAILNMAWSPSFMWDGGVNHIEVFSAAPITNPVEMAETMQNVVNKLNANSDYKTKFLYAYGTTQITDQLLLRALTQFMMMVISDNSKYDDYKRGKVQLTAQEKNGLLLFQSKCASCHKEPLFSDYSFKNNGLDEVFTDLGRGLITQDPADNGKFKVPSLRNVALTYPYMHDGRFFTLNQVLEHYRHGIKQSSTLAPELVNGISMTDSEKEDIIQFLNTLTDYKILESKLLQEPVK